MDRPWQDGAYKATIVEAAVKSHLPKDILPEAADVIQYENPSPEILEELQHELRFQTNVVITAPYDPESWLGRAQVLLRLGYPELVLGDCCKARLLLDAVENSYTVIASESDQAHGHVQATTNLNSGNEASLSDKVKLYAGMRIWLQTTVDMPLEVAQWSEEGWQLRFRRHLRASEHKLLVLSVEAHLMSSCLYESIKACRAGKRKFFKDGYFKQSLDDALLPLFKIYRDDSMEDELRNVTGEIERRRKGPLHFQQYPWMTESELRRSTALIKSAADRCLTTSGRKCTIRSSDLRADFGHDEASDCYGAFAMKNIKKDESVLVDVSPIGAIDNADGRCDNCARLLSAEARSLSCCNVKFCNKQCAQKARTTYHKAVCGKDLSVYQQASTRGTRTRTTASRTLLFLRILAMAVQSDVDHPLAFPIIAQLKPRDEGMSAYHYEHQTELPMQMLQMLGIDVFTNLNYDSWVLRTIQSRLNNNTRGDLLPFVGLMIISINPLYTFFNHSCRPNVNNVPDFLMENPGTDIELLATRDIKAGEELFVSYTAEDRLPLAQRRELVKSWVGGPCQCSKCREEEAAEGHGTGA